MKSTLPVMERCPCVLVLSAALTMRDGVEVVGTSCEPHPCAMKPRMNGAPLMLRFGRLGCGWATRREGHAGRCVVSVVAVLASSFPPVRCAYG